MNEKTTFTRRILVAGTAALAAAPAVAAAPATTPIAQLWSEAQALGSRLAAHRSAIAAAALRSQDGVPGWMRLGGEANRIAEARYQKLVAILNETPRHRGDLAILAKVSQDTDISAGARAWAAERLAAATLTLSA